jgi:hypothetical protein
VADHQVFARSAAFFAGRGARSLRLHVLSRRAGREGSRTLAADMAAVSSGSDSPEAIDPAFAALPVLVQELPRRSKSINAGLLWKLLMKGGDGWTL